MNWLFDPETNEYYAVNHFKIGSRIQYSIISIVWELSKNNWVCADHSTLNNQTKNLRGYFKSAQELMTVEDEVEKLINDLLK